MKGSLLAALGLLMAGCAAPAADVAGTDSHGPAPADRLPEESVAPGASASAVETVPFDYEGGLDPRACVSLAYQVCVGVGPPVFTAGAFHLVEEDRRPVSFAFEVTWEAATPLTQELMVWAGPVTPCGNHCWQFEEPAMASGPSPLRIAVEDAGGAEGPLGIHVGVPSQLPPPLHGWARTDQTFTVTGAAAYPA